MEPIRCIFHEQLPQIRRYLRRFVMEGHCPKDFGDGCRRCCDAMTALDDIIPVLDGRGCLPSYPHPPHDDPRWPGHCEGCGGTFRPEQQWQVHLDHLYRNTETGETVALRAMPVGALWQQTFGHGPHGRWLLESNGHRWEDRHDLLRIQLPHLFCRTPGGIWDMDTISSNGDGWTVTGTPPEITARPSILHDRGGWHGWLTDGILTEC